METVTQWFNGDEKPTKIGVYEREYPSGDRRFCAWDGMAFRNCGGSRDATIRFSYDYSLAQNLRWRGLATKQK